MVGEWARQAQAAIEVRPRAARECEREREREQGLGDLAVPAPWQRFGAARSWFHEGLLHVQSVSCRFETICLFSCVTAAGHPHITRYARSAFAHTAEAEPPARCSVVDLGRQSAALPQLRVLVLITRNRMDNSAIVALLEQMSASYALGDVVTQVAALEQLAAMVDDAVEDRATLIGQEVRSSQNLSMLLDSLRHEEARPCILRIIGNLSSDAVDTRAGETRQAVRDLGGFEKIAELIW